MLPYPEPGDAWGADAIKDLADAIVDGLDAAGGLVAVKHALFTGTQTNSTAEGANFAVTNLSITHTLADATNKLVLLAFIGTLGTSQGFGTGAIAIAEDGTLIGVGDADGSRSRISAGGTVAGATNPRTVSMPHIHLVYEPGDTSSHTYTVRAINNSGPTHTLFINRADNDSNDAAGPRGVSALTLMEVKV